MASLRPLSISLTVLPFALAACAQEAPQIGVTVDAVDSRGGLVATVVSDAGPLTIETVVGAETPFGLWREDPERPRFEVDARVVDGVGCPILMQIGGGWPMDPAWYDDLALCEDGQGREHLLDLLPLAVEQLVSMDLPEPSLGAIAGMAAEPESLALSGFVGDDTGFSVGDDPALFSSSVPTPGAYRHYVVRKKKGAFIFPSEWAEHSAVRVSIHTTSGSFVSSYWTCNHGTCANHPSMQRYAYDPMLSAAIIAPSEGCETDYGILSGQHVCNDDTYVQFRTIYYGAFACYLTCGDSDLRLDAP